MLHQSSLFVQGSVSLLRLLWIGVFGCLLVGTGNLSVTHPLVAAPAGTFQLVDNFDSNALGPLNGQNGWQAATGINVINDPTNTLNHVIEVTANGAQAYKALPTTLSNAGTGTLHFRLRRNGHIDGFAGLSDLAAPNDWSSYETQFGAQSGHAADEFIVRDGSQFDVLGNYFADQTWYCVWLLANNANDSYQVYAQGGAFTTPTQLDAAGQSSFSFRNGGNDALLTFLARMDTSKSQGSFYLDDIYVDPTSYNFAVPGNDCGTSQSDTTPPTVDWLAPVGNTQVYYAACGEIVTVEASAIDASGINWLEFARWDAINNVHVPLGTDTSPPYQANVDVCSLNMAWNEIDANAVDNAGNWGSNYIWLYRIEPPPSAEFDAWPPSGNTPLTVAMHIVSTDNLTSCAWEYGDGATGNACTPYHNHTYTTPGSYTVKLTVTGPGGSDSMTRDNYITATSPALPVVQFGAAAYTVSENNGSVPIQVTLNQATGQTVFVSYATSNGTATAGSDYTTTSGTLTFSAGQTSATFTVPILDDTVDEANEETVNLSLSSPTNATLGALATATLLISDNDEPAPAGPTANFSANPTSGVKPLLVHFSDQSTGSITSWLWNFGDGGASAEQNPTHTYNSAGDFTVSLTVTGPGGTNTKTLPTYIHVSEPAPLTPTINAITNGSQTGSYTVAWSSVAGAGSYELREQVNSGSWAAIYNGVNTSYSLSGKTGGEWCYQVRARNGGGVSGWSASQCITVGAATTPPILTLPVQAPAAPGASVTLGVSYQAHGNPISSLLFSVDYDQTRLTADSNGDGTPDAIRFSSNLPASVIKAVDFDAGDTDGELDFTIADFAASPQSLPDSIVVEITLSVVSIVTPPAEAPVRFAISSFGTATGDVAGETHDGSVAIISSPPLSSRRVFLPIVQH